MTKKKEKEAKVKKNALPADVIKFAKQMGIDLEGLEPEAQEIWTKLNDMSMRDPSQYEKFVAEQMEIAKEEGLIGDKKTTPSVPSSSSSNETKTFRPEG